MLCAFPRHSLLTEISLYSCIQRCETIKGCEAINFKLIPQRRVGYCIIIAAPDADILVTDEDGWYLYAMTYD